MPERFSRPTPTEPPRPEPLILTQQDQELLELLLPAEEIALLHQVEQGQVPCPACDQPLQGMVMIAEEYEGLTLVCLGCGLCEY